MSIRKRLILSNIAMVLIPVILFILAVVLIFTIFFGDSNTPWSFYNNVNNPDISATNQAFTNLKKVASLTPEQLEDRNFLVHENEKLMKNHASLIVRKHDEITFKPSNLNRLSINDLPSFGQEKIERPVERLGSHLYNMQSYDFYYADGSDGTIFLVRDVSGFMKFGRKFFPLMFAILLLILIATNGLLSYFVSKSIVRPVHELMDAAQNISEGNLDFKIVNKKKDELGKLAQMFDHMRQRLKESTDLQLKYEENRKELISNISHDLKTPITSIKGYVEGIRDGVANTPEKMERYLQTIYTKSIDMDKLIDELSLYSKLDLNRLPFNFEKININAFLLDLMDELKFDLDNDGVTLNYENEQDVPYNVIADREKIKRVFINVLTNSLKYMDKKVKQVSINLKEKTDFILVKISDNGPGIPEASLPHIFDRFYRAEQSRNTRTGGSGLGLAIAKRIVEEHGGEIWAESKQGEGTSICFTLKKAKGDSQ